jgi:hypothetical protein
MPRIINSYRLFVGCFLPNWLLAYPEVSYGARIIYAKLSQYAGEDGQAFPMTDR